jgi:hypothetical protein
MNGQSWPATFAEALDSLDSLIPAATKQYLRSLDETGLDREHWGLGLAIRNVLGLWREDAPLTRWFATRGFTQGDEMGNAILRAYWRRLHGLEAEPEPRNVIVTQDR